MPMRTQHINNISFQLELQNSEACKLIDDLALLEECSVSITISVDTLREAADDMQTG